MPQKFYSNGKLLLSGEYAVLDGALAWAVPTKFGQHLSVDHNTTSQLFWKSFDDKEGVWFEGIFDLTTLTEITSSDRGVSEALEKILVAARKLNPSFLSSSKGCDIETELTFHKDWGLGSSSTLLNNISQWADIDPFELSQLTFGGSGYDIACARYNNPILYQLHNKIPKIDELNQHPPFSDRLYFIYLNRKQNSRDAIVTYNESSLNKKELVREITHITKKMISSVRISDFETLIAQHENALSSALNTPTIKSRLFPDYRGAIKSLGAWGGDFILATSDRNPKGYFAEKGYHTIIPYEEMIL